MRKVVEKVAENLTINFFNNIWDVGTDKSSLRLGARSRLRPPAPF
jgi:hypothetical protein